MQNYFVPARLGFEGLGCRIEIRDLGKKVVKVAPQAVVLEEGNIDWSNVPDGVEDQQILQKVRTVTSVSKERFTVKHISEGRADMYETHKNDGTWLTLDEYLVFLKTQYLPCQEQYVKTISPRPCYIRFKGR